MRKIPDVNRGLARKPRETSNVGIVKKETMYQTGNDKGGNTLRRYSGADCEHGSIVFLLHRDEAIVRGNIS